MAKYGVSFPTVQKILVRARHGDFTVHRSVNKRYRCLEYGLKRLSKVSARIEAKLKKQAIRYEKSYPGELFHFDTKCLPLLKNETRMDDKYYLFVAIDDYSRELYAGSIRIRATGVRPPSCGRCLRNDPTPLSAS